jgi:hypothetical protein
MICGLWILRAGPLATIHWPIPKYHGEFNISISNNYFILKTPYMNSIEDKVFFYYFGDKYLENKLGQLKILIFF